MRTKLGVLCLPLLATLCLPLLAAPAIAQTTSIEMSDTVPGTALTYLDLVKIVAPDVKQVVGRYEGLVNAPVRSLAFPEDKPVTDLTLAFYSANAIPFVSDSVPLLGLLLETEEEFDGAVLVVFDLTHPEQIVDLADVSSDQFTAFDHPTLLPLGDRDDGILVSNSHFNSSQGYRSTDIIALLDGKLTDMASVFTFNENYCGLRREQLEAISPVTSDSGDRWQPFAITVTEVTGLTPGECDTLPEAIPGTRAVAAAFRWDQASASFKPDSTALDELYKQTAERF